MGFASRDMGAEMAKVKASSALKRRSRSLTRKFITAATKVPPPFIDQKQGNKVGLISYGSSSDAMVEARALLKSHGLDTSHLVLRALPFTAQVEEFLKNHQRIYVVEQNRDGQLACILRSELPQYWSKCHSVLHYDGMPLDAETVVDQVVGREKTWM